MVLHVVHLIIDLLEHWFVEHKNPFLYLAVVFISGRGSYRMNLKPDANVMGRFILCILVKLFPL